MFGTDRQRTARGHAWMVSFVDLLLLLLAFFILMFAMSAVRQQEWNDLVRTLTARLNPGNVWGEPQAAPGGAAPSVATARAYDLDYLSAVLNDKIAGEPTLAQGRLQRIGDRLLLSFPVDMLFAPGSATPSDAAEDAVRALGAVLQHVGNRVEIVGHADPTPLSAASPFASNWELSLARAIAVANAIKQSGYGFDIDAYGAADGRFGDLSPMLPEAARERLARRVDLIIRETPAWGEGRQ